MNFVHYDMLYVCGYIKQVESDGMMSIVHASGIKSLQPSKRRQINPDPVLTAPLPLSSSVPRIRNIVLLSL
ncbi:hypothetical protein ACN38_g547 [Penicillium nordicum]|uniref:Uncharacterized protein n=1 Tax=Penicillium nordicum TaxID=229535 RepID=A0A0M9WKP2_9EURO|nr:hypothetical protein ACN38_g547 [Penicillium nordicum]